MRIPKAIGAIVCVGSVLLTTSVVTAALDLDEIIVGMRTLQGDAKEYSGLIDMAFQELRNEDSEKLHELTSTINEKTESILRRSKDIAQQIESYHAAAQPEADSKKIEEISRLLQSTQQIFNPAFQRIGNLTKLVFKRDVQDILKILARELDESYKNNNSYPDRLDQFANLFGKQPYAVSYQKIDAAHFKVAMTPIPEALSQGVVLPQKFILTEDQTIRIFDLSDKLVGTVDIKDMLQ